MTKKIKPPEGIISINPGKIYFGNKEAVKDMIVALLNCTITSAFQADNRQQYLEHIPNISIF